jgi:F-box domain
MAEVPQQQANSLLGLPRDVQLCILARCGTSALAAVAVTCSRLRSLARTDELWRPAAEYTNAGKPALAELFRAVIADAHWLRRPPSASCGPEAEACAPAAAAAQTAAYTAAQGHADGGEWLLTRNGTRLRERRILCRQAASFVPYLTCTGLHAPL